MDYREAWYAVYDRLGMDIRLRTAEADNGMTGAQHKMLLREEARAYMVTRRAMRDFDESLTAEDGTDEI